MPEAWSSLLSMEFVRNPIVLTLLAAALAAAVVFPLGLLLARLSERVTRRSFFLNDLLRRARKPLRLLLPLLAVLIVLGSAPPGLPVVTELRRVAAILLIILLTWMALRGIGSIERYITIRHPVDMADNLQARKIQTQSRVLTKALATLVIILGASGILMTFPTV